MSAALAAIPVVPIDVDDLGAAAAELRTAIERHDVVRLRPNGPTGPMREFYDRFVEAVGSPVDIAEDWAQNGAPTGERWSEIRYRTDVPDNVAFRHSKNAQPLHTDESYVSKSAGIMFFYCEQAAPDGGETVFVDGPALVNELRNEAPDLFAQLTTVDVTYQKAGDSVTRPIITFDPDPGNEAGRPNFNFNYYCAEPDQSAEALALNAAFFDYLAERLPAELIAPVGLANGDAVVWRDSRVLHGRNSFEAAETGDRTIWKTAIALDGETRAR